MLNYKSVNSSEPQIRSNPALRSVSEQSGFQKRLSTLLEPTPLPFPTFQLFRHSHQPILSNHVFYGWVRPAHLRSQWLILANGMPCILKDPRTDGRTWSIRIPFDGQAVQRFGPIVCECAWDAQSHILWIWDVVIWDKQVIWGTEPYSKRWELVKQVVQTILDCGHPMSDAEVRVPTWTSLEGLSTLVQPDSAMSIEIQPEKAGQRRFVFRLENEDIQFKPTNHHERKMVAEASAGTKQTPKHAQSKQTSQPSVNKSQVSPVQPTGKQPPSPPIQPLVQQTSVQSQLLQTSPPKPSTKPSQPKSAITVARVSKDTISKLPDTYQLATVTGEPLGLASIRSMELSKKLRDVFQTATDCLADVQWHEPFQKYEIRRIYS